MARDIFRNIASWWDVKSPHVSSFEEWEIWTSSLSLSSRRKQILEGIIYIGWWSIWNFRNQVVFGSTIPSKASLFDDIMWYEALWLSSRDRLMYNIEKNLPEQVVHINLEPWLLTPLFPEPWLLTPLFPTAVSPPTFEQSFHALAAALVAVGANDKSAIQSFHHDSNDRLEDITGISISVTLFTFLGSSAGGRSEYHREYDRAIRDSLVKSSATSLPTFLSAI
ncbi:hypothetical protein Tco_0792468 [Tanacetum coccineum]